MTDEQYAQRLELANVCYLALVAWTRGQISAVECARRCPCTFSEWDRLWPKIGRTTSPQTIIRLINRVILRGEGGGL